MLKLARITVWGTPSLNWAAPLARIDTGASATAAVAAATVLDPPTSVIVVVIANTPAR